MIRSMRGRFGIVLDNTLQNVYFCSLHITTNPNESCTKGYDMKLNMFFGDPISVTIPDQSLQEMIRGLEASGNLKVPFGQNFPEPCQWGLAVTNHGQRTLRLTEFSRDMFWEKEVDDTHETLVKQDKELALIEDLLAIMDESVYSKLPRGFTILCLGSPAIFDLEPLLQSISTRTQTHLLRFTPYEGCCSSSGSRVLVADLTGEPSPRSLHFPFPKN